MFIRGGTGVIFNNTITGTWGEPYISFDNVRSFDNRPQWFPVNDTTNPGRCDGTSPWDANTVTSGPGAGNLCRDQIGAGGDVSTWTAVATMPAQLRVPAYIWNNTINGATATVQIRNNSGPWIAPGRDYIANAGARPGYTALVYPHPLAVP
jgi:hypothetical protein